jgi:hypothetical protein
MDHPILAPTGAIALKQKERAALPVWVRRQRFAAP